MLAIYFALSDNRKYLTLTKFVKGTITKNLKIQIRSDSKSTIEQLIGKCEIKDALIQRICDSISRLLERIPQSIKFSHVKEVKISRVFCWMKRGEVYEILACIWHLFWSDCSYFPIMLVHIIFLYLQKGAPCSSQLSLILSKNIQLD